MISALSYHYVDIFGDIEGNEILKTGYEQPIYYLYGTEDPFYEQISQWVVHEGDYIEEIHNESHKIPRLISPKIDNLISFLSKIYEEKFSQSMEIQQEINQEYLENYIQSYPPPQRSKL